MCPLICTYQKKKSSHTLYQVEKVNKSSLTRVWLYIKGILSNVLDTILNSYEPSWQEIASWTGNCQLIVNDCSRCIVTQGHQANHNLSLFKILVFCLSWFLPFIFKKYCTKLLTILITEYFRCLFKSCASG